MSLVDVFGKEDRTEVKFSQFFALVKQAAQYETLMNAVNCDVPHRFIRETMTGKKEEVPEIPEKKEAVLGVVKVDFDAEEFRKILQEATAEIEAKFGPAEGEAAPGSYMVQPEDREDGAAVDIILKGKRQMKRKYGVVDYLRKHYPPPEGSGEVEVEFLEGYDSIEGPDGSMGFGVFVPTEEKIYIADDLPGGEESMIETVAHEWKHWLQYCNDESHDEEEAEDFARQIVEEFL